MNDTAQRNSDNVQKMADSAILSLVSKISAPIGALLLSMIFVQILELKIDIADLKRAVPDNYQALDDRIVNLESWRDTYLGMHTTNRKATNRSN